MKENCAKCTSLEEIVLDAPIQWNKLDENTSLGRKIKYYRCEDCGLVFIKVEQ